jgi:hypothetical protein
LHRDHKGTWRVFPLTAAPAAAESGEQADSGAPSEGEIVAKPIPVVGEILWQEGMPASEQGDAESTVVSSEVVDVSAEPEAEAAPAGRKPRKARPARGTARSKPRKTPAKRKTKEPASD